MLRELSARVCERIEELLDDLGVGLKPVKNYYSGCCPIHGGDNTTAITLYVEGDFYVGNWQCHTRKCHDHFPQISVIGFIRGVLSHQEHGWEKEGDGRVSHRRAVDHALKFLGIKIEDVGVDEDKEDERRFIRDMAYLSRRADDEDEVVCTRDEFRSGLAIPARYYLERGYSARILDEYDVGLCRSPRPHPMAQMTGRVVVPLYGENSLGVIGCVGRSPHAMCDRCRTYHPPQSPCPEFPRVIDHAKWICSDDFVDKHHLYNYWRSRTHIEASKCVVIVEGAGDVWRLEEAGIHNSVALLGSNLSSRQAEVLECCGGGHLVVMTDNDEAGDKAASQIMKECPFANFHRLRPPDGAHDVGEMTVDQVKNSVLPFIRTKMRKY